MAVPTFACSGLVAFPDESRASSVVAPASECTAPSEAPMPARERSSATMREGVANSATSVATRIAGVRCSSSRSQVAERLIQVMRFMAWKKREADRETEFERMRRLLFRNSIVNRGPKMGADGGRFRRRDADVPRAGVTRSRPRPSCGERGARGAGGP